MIGLTHTIHSFSTTKKAFLDSGNIRLCIQRFSENTSNRIKEDSRYYSIFGDDACVFTYSISGRKYLLSFFGIANTALTIGPTSFGRPIYLDIERTSFVEVSPIPLSACRHSMEFLYFKIGRNVLNNIEAFSPWSKGACMGRIRENLLRNTESWE